LFDTGAWFAVAVQNDPDHAAAMRWLGQNREPLITTDHVLAETATLIRMRDKTARGHRLAVRVASSILRQQSAILQNVALADLQKALQVFRDYSDHLFSFVDCTSFAVMERLGINHATPSLLIVTSTSIAESFGCLARNGRTCACHAFNYLIPTMDSIICGDDFHVKLQ
jgi:uncharacterized protein